jgi:glycerol uptake facilitator-like aquaporin
MKFGLRVRVTAEFMGTAFLVAAVVGSGIMGDRLAGGNVAIALLANTIATGAALVALILTFGSISGAHFNPAVPWLTLWSVGFRGQKLLSILLPSALAGLLAQSSLT